jgi:hypothetical protein
MQIVSGGFSDGLVHGPVSLLDAMANKLFFDCGFAIHFLEFRFDKNMTVTIEVAANDTNEIVTIILERVAILNSLVCRAGHDF